MKKKILIPSNAEQQSDLLLAAKVAAKIEAMDIRLVSTNVRHNPLEALGASVRFNTKALQYKVDRESSQIFVKPHFVVEIDYEESEGFLLIEAEFLLTYSIKSFDGLSEDNIDAFSDKNGLYNCWPYLREYVQSTTARLGIKVLTLPPFRPTDTLREVGRLGQSDKKKRIPSKKTKVRKTKSNKKKRPSKKKDLS